MQFMTTLTYGTGERNRGYALSMKAIKLETVLHRAPTFSLLVTHGGISSCTKLLAQ